MPTLNERYRGMLLGTAVGDTVGLPAEGIPRSRVGRMFKGPWRQRFVFGHGMISDDTEHTLFTTQCLLAHPNSAELFGRRLGSCLKWWFLSLPAGIGMATARACIKLTIGFSHRRSGVFSAGNGPAMRVAPIGAFFYNAPENLSAFTQVCTTITHTDPKAVIGANAIAFTAAWIVRDNLTARPPIDTFCRLLRNIAPDNTDWGDLVTRIGNALEIDSSVTDFATSLGQEREVTGFIYHTVPVVLFAWHRHFGDYSKTLSAVIECGGDTDTTGAIVGALAGLTVGEAGIPKEWIDGIADWPRSVALLRRSADRLSNLRETGSSSGSISYFWPGVLPRNALFLQIVLFHGFRRLFPPY